MKADKAVDVVVAGGGVAALVAALTACERGARVVLFERAPRRLRGGNGRLTGGNVRIPFDSIEQLLPFLPDREAAFWAGIDVFPYPPAEFVADVARLTGKAPEASLVPWLAEDGYAAMRWLLDAGVRWTVSTTFSRSGEQRPAFRNGMVLAVDGGGAALVETLYDRAERAGIELRYESEVTGLLAGSRGAIEGLAVHGPENVVQMIACARVVLASGGFQANPALRERYLGSAWRDVRVRAVRFDTGELLEDALRLGAVMYGAANQCHACPVDPSCPAFGDDVGGEGPLRLSFPYGITVNVEGQRFMDEGRDLAARTYAAVGRAIVEQPQSRAFQIFDASGSTLLDAYYAGARPVVRDTPESLAAALDIPPTTFAQTVASFNEAVDVSAPFRTGVLDGRRANTTPPKSNWAMRLETPPFAAYEVVAGITFTYGGLRIDRSGAVLRADGTRINGLFAAGDITGGFFSDPYPAGCGIIRNVVTARAAGASASG